MFLSLNDCSPQNTSWVNPLAHIGAFWCLCSRRVFENKVTKEAIAQKKQFLLMLFENKVTKEAIAQNKQFLLMSQCFPLLIIGYAFDYRDFLFFDKICSKSSAAELSYEGKG